MTTTTTTTTRTTSTAIKSTTTTVDATPPPPTRNTTNTEGEQHFSTARKTWCRCILRLLCPYKGKTDEPNQFSAEGWITCNKPKKKKKNVMCMPMKILPTSDNDSTLTPDMCFVPLRFLGAGKFIMDGMVRVMMTVDCRASKHPWKVMLGTPTSPGARSLTNGKRRHTKTEVGM